MAAPSVGRRSCAGQRKAAALISQSRRRLNKHAKGLLNDGLFFFAVVQQFNQLFLYLKCNRNGKSIIHHISRYKTIQAFYQLFGD